MNIFVTDSCPIQSAKNLDDKRVIKMVLETAQILSTVMRQRGILDAPYKPTHLNHPCVKWVLSDQFHVNWLLDHFEALCSEFRLRQGKRHKCQEFASLFQFTLGKYKGDSVADIQFVNCAGNKTKGVDYTNMKCITTAYQLYLNDRWDTDKQVPTWYGERR